jgi:hypothetical protein
MPRAQLEEVLLEDRRIIFRNFSGAEGKFNAKGDRNFNVLLTDAEAERMITDGWNVKWLQPREEGDLPQARLDVTVSYKGRPPRVVLISSRGRTNLDEGDLPLLDWCEIEKVDMILNPYHWNVNEKSGVKAYLKAIYVIIHEDALELKYLDVPDTALSGLIKEEAF